MPSHPQRPRDPRQLAKSIVDIATGEPLRDPLEPVKFPLITYADCFISALGPLYCEARSFIGAKEARVGKLANNGFDPKALGGQNDLEI